MVGWFTNTGGQSLKSSTSNDTLTAAETIITNWCYGEEECVEEGDQEEECVEEGERKSVEGGMYGGE